VCRGALPRPCSESEVADPLGGKCGVQSTNTPTGTGRLERESLTSARRLCSVCLTPGACHNAHWQARDSIDQASRATVLVNKHPSATSVFCSSSQLD
jgi:hypothetical protein